MQIQSMSVTPNTPPRTTPLFFFIKSRTAAVRLLIPLTISSAMPGNRKF